jgi:cell division inhibitor SulA/protein ImuA
VNATLEKVLQHPAVWRMGAVSRIAASDFSTGFAALDRELPGCGWPQAGLIELLCDESGVGELSLLLPAIAALSGSGRNVCLIAPPYLPYAPAFAQAGVALKRLMIVRPKTAQEMWWATEQAMRAGACGAVLAWAPVSASTDYAMLRRLQLAASQNSCTGFVFRTRACEKNASPAPLRIRLEATRGELMATILKRRGALNSQPILLATSANRWADVRKPVTLPTARLSRERIDIDVLLRTQTRVPLVERHYPIPNR